MPSPQLHVLASDPLATKVGKITRFLGEDFFHESGLMYAMGHYRNGEVRPLRESDFVGASGLNLKAGTPMWDLYNMENSPYTSGLFLWSQVLRYQVTKEKEALRFAAKAFRSLDLNFQMCVANGERGFLCKPYGMKFSRETSPDQYVSVLLALWNYREMVDAPTRRRIDEMIPAMSDWWRTRKYKIDYFDIPGGCWLPDNEACPSQYGPVFVMMHLMAHRITGRAECRDEAQRIIKWLGTFPTRYDVCRQQMLRDGTCFWPEKLHGYEYDSSRRPYLMLDWENSGAIWLAAAPAAWLHDHEPSLRPLMEHAIGNYYRTKIRNLTPDLGVLYWTQFDLETNQSYPLVRPRISTDVKDYIIGLNWNLFAYASKIITGDVGGRILDMAMLAHHYAPGFSPGALTLAKRMLAKLDDQRLATFWDPTGEEFMPEDRWLTEVLSSETPSLAALTYWQAKSWGTDLEN